jgi:hypothetical protein
MESAEEKWKDELKDQQVMGPRKDELKDQHLGFIAQNILFGSIGAATDRYSGSLAETETEFQSFGRSYRNWNYVINSRVFKWQLLRAGPWTCPWGSR